ncbi:hypothetical protein GCM10009623_14380 [Nocardioides aestuarii]
MGRMADHLPDRRDRPVIYGLLALVGVAVVVGVVMGLSALAGAKVLGVDGAEEASTGGAEASMYLPKLEKTKAADGPTMTLAPGESAPAEPDSSPSETKTKKKKAKVISLSASQTSVAPMEQIDLTGTYPGGEGAILQVQRFENGGWTDFPASPVSVSDQTFSTYVQTGQPGAQRFRVVDTDTGKTSNEVKVTIGG